MFDPKQHEHRAGKWEADPKREQFSVRCTVCGKLMEWIDFEVAIYVDPRLQFMVDEIRQGGSGG